MVLRAFDNPEQGLKMNSTYKRNNIVSQRSDGEIQKEEKHRDGQRRTRGQRERESRGTEMKLF